MKKTFRSILAGAVALLAVSCYDDSALKEEIKGLDERVTAIEKTLSAEVGGINNLLSRIESLEGKIAAIKVETNDGVTTLTLSDNTSVVLSKNGVLTIVDGGWATVAADGTVTPLGIPVSHDHKLAFKVEGGELKVSYDGTTYEATGVKVSEYTAHVIGNVVPAADGKSVAVTIGDQTLQLPLVSSAVATLGLSRDSFFLRYTGEKVVEITAEGLAEVYVMNEPDGWKANVDGNSLTITAPTKKAVEIGAAENEGLVLIHATTDEGKCVVAKLEVSAGPGLTLSVDNSGLVTIENSYSGLKTSMWGETSFGFSDFVFGLATPADFNADPVKYVETYNSTWSAPNYEDIIFPSLYNVVEGGIYEEGVYETDIIKTNVSDIYYSYTWAELPAGSHFVLWAAPVEGEGQAVVDELVYVEYVCLKHNVAVKSVSHSDVTLTAEVAGGVSYIINCVAESYYNNEYNPMTFEEYMMAPMGGPWNSFISYGAAEALGMSLPAEGVPAEFNLSDILGEKLAFGETYKVWVMPLLAHKNKIDEANSYPEYGYIQYDFSAYDFEKDFLPYVIEVKTNDIVAGGNYAATYALKSSNFSDIYVDVTLSEGTDITYYAWYSVEEYAEFENDDLLMASVIENCYTPLTASGVASKTYEGPGKDFMLVSFSVGTDGKYGEIVAERFSTLPIPKSSAITVSKVSLSDDGTNYIIEVAVSGASRVMGYNITATDTYEATFYENVAENGHKLSYYGYEFADVVDGKATLTVKKNSYKKNYYVAGLNVTDGIVSAISDPVLLLDLAEATPAN